MAPAARPRRAPKVNLLPRTLKLNSLTFLKSPKSSAHASCAWRHSPLLVPFPIWGFILTSVNDVSSPRTREHLRSCLHLTNPCTKRKVLSLTKPKGKIYKTKSLDHYNTVILYLLTLIVYNLGILWMEMVAMYLFDNVKVTSITVRWANHILNVLEKHYHYFHSSFFWKKHYAESICFIVTLYLYCLKSNAFKESTNKRVASFFFARIPSRIQWIVTILDVVNRFLWKLSWFFKELSQLRVGYDWEAEDCISLSSYISKSYTSVRVDDYEVTFFWIGEDANFRPFLFCVLLISKKYVIKVLCLPYFGGIVAYWPLTESDVPAV